MDPQTNHQAHAIRLIRGLHRMDTVALPNCSAVRNLFFHSGAGYRLGIRAERQANRLLALSVVRDRVTTVVGSAINALR